MKSSDIFDSLIILAQFEVEISFRKCIEGEVIQNNKCIVCPKGFYSLHPDKSVCK
jgi:hypothetical protein